MSLDFVSPTLLTEIIAKVYIRVVFIVAATQRHKSRYRRDL
jgi:hypothetical protein